jgi:hypothetical protein
LPQLSIRSALDINSGVPVFLKAFARASLSRLAIVTIGACDVALKTVITSPTIVEGYVLARVKNI